MVCDTVEWGWSRIIRKRHWRHFSATSVRISLAGLLSDFLTICPALSVSGISSPVWSKPWGGSVREWISHKHHRWRALPHFLPLTEMNHYPRFIPKHISHYRYKTIITVVYFVHILQLAAGVTVDIYSRGSVFLFCFVSIPKFSWKFPMETKDQRHCRERKVHNTETKGKRDREIQYYGLGLLCISDEMKIGHREELQSERRHLWGHKHLLILSTRQKVG